MAYLSLVVVLRIQFLELVAVPIQILSQFCRFLEIIISCISFTVASCTMHRPGAVQNTPIKDDFSSDLGIIIPK